MSWTASIDDSIETPTDNNNNTENIYPPEALQGGAVAIEILDNDISIPHRPRQPSGLNLKLPRKYGNYKQSSEFEKSIEPRIPRSNTYSTTQSGRRLSKDDMHVTSGSRTYTTGTKCVRNKERDQEAIPDKQDLEKWRSWFDGKANVKQSIKLQSLV